MDSKSGTQFFRFSLHYYVLYSNMVIKEELIVSYMSNVFISEGCPQIKQIFCLETVSIHGISMCEGVGEDSRHRIGHVDIRVGIMNSLECVCFPLHEHLGGE